MATNRTIKVVLLGDTGVGKTSLIKMFESGTFSCEETPTIGGELVTKDVVLDCETVTLQVWDTAGQERFQSLGPIYYSNGGLSPGGQTRGAGGALVVYDSTSRKSFEGAIRWVRELSLQSDLPACCCLVGNKSDADGVEVPAEEGAAYAKSVNFKHFVVSAKNNENIKEPFLTIAREVKQEERVPPPLMCISMPPDRPGPKALFGLVDEERGCC